jgi:DNA-binding transcriptional MerR regulator
MKDLSIKKLYYSISEVSKITEMEQYVLRYWETEFEQLKPQKNRAGNRIYTNKDIQVILQIKSLLRDKKYTIEGAKKILEDFPPEKIIMRMNLHFSNPELQ